MKKLLITVSVLIFIPFVVIACHGSDSNSSPPTTQQQIQQLEASGVIPTLDRSADLKGPDADNNGIRDDIDAYIAKQNYTAPQKAAVQQYVKSIQAAVAANTTDRTTAIALSKVIHSGINCVYENFLTGHDAWLLNRRYQGLVANTKPRLQSYLAYNHALNGTVSDLPTGGTCDK